MRKFTVGLMLWMCGVSFLIGATQAKAAPANGLLRIVQASPDTTAVDVYINGNKAISNLKYQDISDYNVLPGGNYGIKIMPTSANSTPDQLINIPDFNISEGSINTIIVAGLEANKSLTAIPLRDTDWQPSQGMARVRFIHGSPDTPAVVVNVEGLGNVFSNISFKQAGEYLNMPAGTFKVSVNTINGGNTVLSKSITLEAGKSYTIFAVGLSSSKSVNALVSVDNALPIAMPDTGLGGAVKHASVIPSWSWLLLLVPVSLTLTTAFIRVRKTRKDFK